MLQAIVYSQPNCPACVTAKTTLRIHGYTVEERVLGSGWTKEQLLEDFPQARSVPQVIVGDLKIGGVGPLLEYLGK